MHGRERGMTEIDIVIVGAGAAGIGAGLELADQGVSFVILEAAPRVGGRAFTDSQSLGQPWDHGCHWLHCADVNPLVAYADRLGARYRKADPDEDFTYWQDGGFAGVAKRAAAGRALDAAETAIDRAGAAGRDVALTEVVDLGGPHGPTVRCVLQLLAGADPEDVSALSYWDYEDTEADWPVLSGLGAVVAGMAQGLPIRTGTAVTAIKQGAGGEVTVETPSGTIRAKGAIVTASTNVLASGAIAFGPGPARDLLGDIARVPCGVYEKVALELPALPPEAMGRQFCIVDPGNAQALEFVMIAGSPALVVANMAGSWVSELAGEGPGALEAFAREQFALAFGADLARSVRGAAVTGWHDDPFVRGSYSHAVPGAARTRHRMIEADTGTVAFAGEAFSLDYQATAHGAYMSGRDVARHLARRLSRAPQASP
jgi:monoamine oxidase